MARYSTWQEAVFFLSHPRIWFRRPLELADLNRDPVAQFDTWFTQARTCFTLEFPNALVLSTVDLEGKPNSRVVLLKEFGPEGFLFYTNRTSQKGQELASTPHAAMCFYWGPLQRQVRIRGRIELVADAVSDQYFASRPRGSQLSAWASNQSTPIGSRDELTHRQKDAAVRFAGSLVPRPPHWGGYRLVPAEVEFWELRMSRLHDRFRYRKDVDGRWQCERLSP